MEGWFWGCPWGSMCREEHPHLCLWMSLSCSPFLSLFWRRFTPIVIDFFWASYLPDFCSNRSNTNKLQITSQMQKKTKNHSKHLKMSHFDISFQTIIFIWILRPGEWEGVRGSGGVESFCLTSHHGVWALQLLWKLSESCLAWADVNNVCVRERMRPCGKDNR